MCVRYQVYSISICVSRTLPHVYRYQISCVWDIMRVICDFMRVCEISCVRDIMCAWDIMCVWDIMLVRYPVCGISRRRGGGGGGGVSEFVSEWVSQWVRRRPWSSNKNPDLRIWGTRTRTILVSGTRHLCVCVSVDQCIRVSVHLCMCICGSVDLYICVSVGEEGGGGKDEEVEALLE